VGDREAGFRSCEADKNVLGIRLDEDKGTTESESGTDVEGATEPIALVPGPTVTRDCCGRYEPVMTLLGVPELNGPSAVGGACEMAGAGDEAYWD